MYLHFLCFCDNDGAVSYSDNVICSAEIIVTQVRGNLRIISLRSHPYERSF